MKVNYRIVHNPELAKASGWSRNHRLLEMFVVGKWRAITFATDKQIESGKWKEQAKAKLKVNAGVTSEVEFVKYSDVVV